MPRPRRFDPRSDVGGRGISSYPITMIVETRLERKQESADSAGRVVETNLAVMHHDMERLLVNESMGGNAGTTTVEGLPCSCAAANFFADPVTGEIRSFGNHQDVDPDVVATTHHGSMIGAFSLKIGDFVRIVRLMLDIDNVGLPEDGHRDLRPEARAVIEESIRCWNQERTEKYFSKK